jgi:RNase P subunit RPR2
MYYDLNMEIKKESGHYSKKEIESLIMEKLNSGNLSKETLKKLKNLAMSKNVKIGSLKKKYCKKCFTLFDSKNSEIRIKKGLKNIRCKGCGYITRYKIKNKVIKM